MFVDETGSKAGPRVEKTLSYCPKERGRYRTIGTSVEKTGEVLLCLAVSVLVLVCLVLPGIVLSCRASYGYVLSCRATFRRGLSSRV